MNGLWGDGDIVDIPIGDDIASRVYSSRLLGKDNSLVLHDGDNTSVKVVEKDRFGVEEEILYVKGSGWGLETIEAEGFFRFGWNI